VTATELELLDEDRRVIPSHSYRADHIIVEVSGRLVEIQVRTTLQNLWADLSERLADRFDPAIKYGGGPEELRLILEGTSKAVEGVEELERRAALSGPATPGERERLQEIKQELVRGFNEVIESATRDSAKEGRP